MLLTEFRLTSTSPSFSITLLRTSKISLYWDNCTYPNAVAQPRRTMKFESPWRCPIHFRRWFEMSKRLLNEPRASDAASCNVSKFFCREFSITIIYDCSADGETGRLDSDIHWIKWREERRIRFAWTDFFVYDGSLSGQNWIFLLVNERGTNLIKF